MAYNGAVVPFCIDAAVLGTDRHLVSCADGFTWHATVPKDMWHLSGRVKPDSDWCLDTVLRLGGATVDLAPPVRFVNAMATVSSGSNITAMPWQRIMPARAHRAFVQGIIDQVVVAMAKAPVNYYRDTWVPGNAVIRSLRPAVVDKGRFDELIKAGEGNVSAIRSFEPDDNGFAEPIIYDRFKTLTGRLTVNSGPQILTLKREHRDLLVSDTGGCIVSVDFAALEARVLLYEAGRRCDEPDLYGMIARDLGYDRKAVKAAVISELYGSSKYALGKVLGIEGKELNSFVRRVKAYFNTRELLNRIKAQFFETGHIINRYGRPVLIDDPMDHIFINYYAQSSGVDVTLLGFSLLVEHLARECPGVRPLYLLHDALILDVPLKYIDEVMATRTVTVPGYVQKFYLKSEHISGCNLKVERLTCTSI